jgi:hypothetical protein
VITVDSNLEQYQSAVVQYIQRLRKDPAKAIRFQMGKLVGRVAKLTPPRSLAQGRRAVKRDVLNAVSPVDNLLKAGGVYDKPSVRKMIRRRNHDEINTFLVRIKSRYVINRFDPTLHERMRDRRGRVQSNKHVLTSDVQQLRDYITKKQGHVGMARGGWVSALKQLRQAVPAWAARWAIAGNFVDRLNNPVFAYVKSENNSPWASRGDDERIVSTAMESRARDVLNSIEHAIAKAGKDMK